MASKYSASELPAEHAVQPVYVADAGMSVLDSTAPDLRATVSQKPLLKTFKHLLHYGNLSHPGYFHMGPAAGAL